MFKLANYCIFGTDANPRMARTSKMNMIMHGDGHCGVHHHDGLLNVNGIYEERFNVILTNPPFGARVDRSQRVSEQEVIDAIILLREKGKRIKVPSDIISEYHYSFDGMYNMEEILVKHIKSILATEYGTVFPG